MTITPTDYEKLGAFYLGRDYDPGTKQMEDSLVMYDSKDLVTHGVVLGMTGSGKTGLCLALLEEAAMDKVPAIVIDPKGDIANFLLTFPNLSPAEFEPWINEEDATKKGKTVPEYAAAQADLWKKGLGDWGQSPERIRTLRDTVDITVFTPGSNSGIPVSILASLGAPSAELIDDSELFAERIDSTAASILGLLGVTGDSISSREHILLSRIFDHAWRKGESLTLEHIIGYVQAPPFAKVGVIEVDEFFPEKKRSEFAMLINNLLAAPSFQTWLSGAPLDIKKMMHTPEGKPRVSIFSIAHLNDAERMFFVSLLLNQMVSWMRSQSGTTSLRALLYMDEIYGYLPPTANPPSKKPMMILLKQARAFGLGILVATQNPVDLDYKALSNIGTWWLGRLQTERDKNRVLDGLEGAASSQGSKFDRSEIDAMLSGLGNRVFLMNNVHEDHPCVFQVRWCMTYLRGPLTRNQIKSLMDPKRSDWVTEAPAATTKAAVGKAKKAATAATEPAEDEAAPATTTSDGRPDLPPSLAQYFFPINSPAATPQPIAYVPMLFSAADVAFADAGKGISEKKRFAYLNPVEANAVAIPTQLEAALDVDPNSLSQAPAADVASWRDLPVFARKSSTYTTIKSMMIEQIYTKEVLTLLYSEVMDEYGKAGESEGDFRVRLQHRAREERDTQVDSLKVKYAARFQDLEADRSKAVATVEREKSQARAAKVSTAVNIGQAVLGALFGRKSVSGMVSRGASAVRGAGRAMDQSGDVERAEAKILAIDEEALALKAEMDGHIQTIQAAFDMNQATFTKAEVKPMKKNIAVTATGLAWVPHYDIGGSLEPAWEPSTASA
jgi:hypothetical protein